ncbi:MAG: DUF4291 family protein, partial [Chryseobacterium sp.]|uniref:DUF4291 family protein n=1 Tax=Chryseobacterium sp. TaxID=1871047 RepID=UPI003D125C9D
MCMIFNKLTTMKEFEIRADYKNNTVVVYQAYNKTIAKAAVENQKFMAPFS